MHDLFSVSFAIYLYIYLYFTTYKHSSSSPLFFYPSLPAFVASLLSEALCLPSKWICLKLAINKAKLNSMSVCLPWSASSAGGSCGPDSHGAPHAGNPLNLTNCCTNKLPLTTEKQKGTHANCVSVHKLNMTYDMLLMLPSFFLELVHVNNLVFKFIIIGIIKKIQPVHSIPLKSLCPGSLSTQTVHICMQDKVMTAVSWLWRGIKLKTCVFCHVC